MSELNEQAKKVTFLPRSPVQRAAAAGLLLFVLLLGAWNFAQVSGRGSDDPEYDMASPQYPGGRFHARPIIEKDGKRLLWARGEPDTPDAEWFDVTASSIDPSRFQYGIGKDTIPSIDEPTFVEVSDARLSDAGINDETMVIGFAHGSEARAYPLHILDRHELVNDRVGGKPVTVGW